MNRINEPEPTLTNRMDIAMGLAELLRTALLLAAVLDIDPEAIMAQKNASTEQNFQRNKSIKAQAQR